MANFKVCNWHLKDTRWGDNENNSVAVHSLCIDINKDEFCMIDYTVNALNGYNAPINSLPYKDQLSGSMSANRIIV